MSIRGRSSKARLALKLRSYKKKSGKKSYKKVSRKYKKRMHGGNDGNLSRRISDVIFNLRKRLQEGSRLGDTEYDARMSGGGCGCSGSPADSMVSSFNLPNSGRKIHFGGYHTSRHLKNKRRSRLSSRQRRRF